MEEERFVSRNFDETPELNQCFQSDKFVEKRCLEIPETITEQSSPSLDDDDIKINALKALTLCFSSDNKENIASNNSVTSDESTVCAMKPFNYSNLIKCEEKLLESSNDEEKSFEVKKMPVDSKKLLQLSEKLKVHNDTISTPPSALREQISILRKEVNEAYEFHDLEIHVLREELKEEPENYMQLIENYSTLLKLYSSLKSEYEEYRRDQEKIRNEFQNKTVNCLESLCSQIETSDNSLNSASFVSFSTDLKCSTMIDNFIEKEATLMHDVTIQTKDPLSDTDIFKTPKFTPFKCANKCFQNVSQQNDCYDPESNVKLIEVESVLSDKAKEIEKLEQRLFKVEDLSGLLQNEFQRISMAVIKENEILKKNLLCKSEQLDILTQKLFTEIISLNSDLVDSLTDAPGTKLLPVLIETIMERCKNIEDKLTIKFNNEKSNLEKKVNNLEEENKNLNEEISCQVFALQELKKSYERQLLEIENLILTRDEEIRNLKTQDFNLKQMEEDFTKKKEEVTRLETKLSEFDNQKQEMEDKYHVLEQTTASLRLELEKIKELCDATEKENNTLNKRLSEIAFENGDLKDTCERLKRQLSEKDDVISSQNEEIQNLRNREIKEMKAALALADEMLLKLKAELFTTESEKLHFEKQCLELENNISTLQTVITTKDTILKDLELFKSSCDIERENMRQQIQEKEVIISDYRMEVETLNNKYSLEVKKIEDLNEKISYHTSEFAELEKSYKTMERKLSEAESKMQAQDEEIQISKTHDFNIRQMEEDFAKKKEEVTRLEAQLSLFDNQKKEMEDKYHNLEQTTAGLRLELEKIKELCDATEKENDTLNERLSEIALENEDLKETCERLKRQLSENDDVISSQKEEIQNMKNREMKEMETALAQADEILLKVKAELLTSESEKLNIEKRCLELENTNFTLQTEMAAKDTILKDLEIFKSSCDIERENMRQQIKEKEAIISDYRMEVETLNNKYSLEVKKTEDLNEKINCRTSEFAELEQSYKIIENKLSEAESKIRTLDEEVRTLQLIDSNFRQTQAELASAKEIIERLEATAALHDNQKKETEDKFRVLEQTTAGLRLELEKIKELCDDTEKENDTLNERLSEIALENCDLKDTCERLKRQLSENDDVISSQKEEIQNLRNREMKEMEAALVQADEILLKVKAELLTSESEKLNIEKRCLELENTNFTLQTEMATKDTILKDLELFKSSCDTEKENMRQQIKEKEVIISDFRMEVETLNHKYSLEIKKTESLNKEIDYHTSAFAELEKSYKIMERKLSEAESKIRTLDEEIRILRLNDANFRQTQDDLASAKEIIGRLEANLQFAENEKEKLEDRCQGLEERCNNLSLDLERVKSENRNIERENENFKKLIQQKNTETDSDGLFEILKEGVEKLKQSSVGDFPKIMKKALDQVKKLQSKAAELKEENEKLDEECDSYAKVIKDLKKEAAVEWKKNKEKMQAFEEEILKLTEIKNELDNEKKELLGKISKMEKENQKLKANIAPEGRDCGCGLDLKKLKELKRTILVKEQKLLELQDMEAQNNSYKSQIEYLKNALDKERKKINEEREKIKKLQNELNEATQNQKIDNKKFEENQILEELRMRGSLSGGVVGEIVDKEKMRKLSKDVGVLKEICRARYAEIKRLEAENAALKNLTPKNSNQTDSPIRSRGCNTKSKTRVVEKWRTEMEGKENRSP